MAIHLSSSVSALPGIGAKGLTDLKVLGVRVVRDLLWYLPFRYDDFSIQKPISELRAGDTVTITGEITSISTRPAKNRRMKLTQATVANETGEIDVLWFNQSYLERTLKEGTKVSLAGRVDDKFGLTLVNPVHEPAGARIHTGRLVPVYGLSRSLTMRRLRTAIESGLPALSEVVDWLPSTICEQERLPNLADALRHIHFPESHEDLDRAVNRLKFDELFLHQLMFARVRAQRTVQKGFPISLDKAFLKSCTERFPFSLTLAQKRAIWEIAQDCERSAPMNRLLEGDVGSGKTAVATVAIANILKEPGLQAAYAAPTELLAQQQQASIQSILTKEHIGLLTGSEAKIGRERVSRKELFAAIESGDLRVLVGTHALFQDTISLQKLALVVIDEQHRFGVEQRHALLETGEKPAPHLLSMTATPIPRSLALSLYGDLELSILDERPAGRKPVLTKLVGPIDEQGMWQHIRGQIQQEGAQVFVVCPLIDPSDALGARSVKDVFADLKTGALKGLRIGLLHGKMKSKEKTQVVESFRLGELDVLISTTVIEVGVDIPGATQMVIVGAERFGLAQLHQLRGRVGRNDTQSYCYLLSEAMGEHSLERLRAMESIHDGFLLAEKDLELRGPGNIFGNAQSGFPDFKLATPADTPIMKKARDYATELLSKDPDLSENPLVRQRVQEELDLVHLE